MGIKDLWTILRPFGERKPLYELQGKTVAIDLSCWVCEAQNISEYIVQPHMYLRNLYFRTCYLLLLGVNPVYVLEGKAPLLKYKTIAARNALQFKGKKPRSNTTKPSKTRSHFNFTLKHCEEMLHCMGLLCIKGSGEAEAMCAYLNINGFVDGVITQDSDSFAYGATTVYRNFSISQQGFSSAAGGAVDEYNIEKLESNNGIGRQKIIALALLCGSDYSDGVFGVGKDSVLKLFNGISDDKILERLRSWRKNADYYEELEKHLAVKNICKQCGHVGKLQSHNLDGCRRCNSSKGCSTRNSEDQQQFVKNELNIRKKALQLPDFPNEELINEYLSNREYIRDLNVKWQQPNIIKFVEFTKKYLEWQEIYAFEKFFPILTRWQLMMRSNINNITYQKCCDDVFYPDYIKKARNPKGVASYEIIWTDNKCIYKQLIPDEQLENIELEKFLSTIEPQDLVQQAYPKLVDKYNSSKIKSKPVRKRRQNSADPSVPIKNRKLKTKNPIVPVNDILLLNKSLDELNLNTGKITEKQTKMDIYFQKVKNSAGAVSKLKETNLDLSSFGDENDLDLSDIVEDILHYEQPKYIQKYLQKVQTGTKDTMDLVNSSYFFITCPTENDFFERTFNKPEDFTSSEESDT